MLTPRTTDRFDRLLLLLCCADCCEHFFFCEKKLPMVVSLCFPINAQKSTVEKRTTWVISSVRRSYYAEVSLAPGVPARQPTFDNNRKLRFALRIYVGFSKKKCSAARASQSGGLEKNHSLPFGKIWRKSFLIFISLDRQNVPNVRLGITSEANGESRTGCLGIVEL